MSRWMPLEGWGPPRPIRVAVCAWCGAQFRTRNPDRRFCSADCRYSFHNREKKRRKMFGGA